MHDPLASRGLSHRIPPPVILLIVAGFVAWAGARLPPTGLSGLLTTSLGCALLVLAGLTGPPAVVRFVRARTTVNPLAIERASVLVTDGIYRWTRNPMYLSMAALLLAQVAFTAQPVLLIGPAIFVAYITRFQIIPEEAAMRRLFGEAYERYAREVRRWL